MSYGLQLRGRDEYERLIRERQAQKIDDCPFCHYKNMLRVLYSGKYWVWGVNGFPYWPYHTLLIPKDHVVTPMEFSPVQLGEFIEIVRIATRKLCATMIDFESVSKILYFWRYRFKGNEKDLSSKHREHFHLHIVPERDRLFDPILDNYAVWDESTLDIEPDEVGRYLR